MGDKGDTAVPGDQYADSPEESADSLYTLGYASPETAPLGIAGLLAHYCITTALKLAPAVIVTPMDFIRLPLIAVVGWVYYNEPLDLFTIVGALIVLAANFGNIFVGHRQKTTAATAAPAR